ncbi:MAG: hypothetical protein NTZ27_11575 [Ignavibacteriales bacterium]|nr:hypothetical protein [Ignavibacteriales bacterium]
MRRMNYSFILLIYLFSLSVSNGQTTELNPGVERWSIKTSLPKKSTKMTIPLTELLALNNPIESYSAKEYGAKRIPNPVQKGLKEGDIVTTRGYLHLVALENDSKYHRDGDYHVQIRNTAEWKDSCLIVEVPNPDARFVSDSKLREKCKVVRDFIKEEFLKGKEPGAGNIMEHKMYVEITGQLFFDASHLKGNPRGKKGMKSYTCWEIHPVTSIKFIKSK